MTIEWIDQSAEKYTRFNLRRDGRDVATIKRQRGIRTVWYGWTKDSGHKFGPFSTKAAAKRWGEKQP
jgi:hypothetical protein